MHPLDLSILAGETIHPKVIGLPRKQGRDILSAAEEGLVGQDDSTLLRRAYSESRIILTHDGDFGASAILQGEPVFGMVYLRPRHIRAGFTIQILKTLSSQPIDVQPPFTIVAAYSQGKSHTRVRQL